MAEASKPAKADKIKPPSSKTNETKAHEEITDRSLEKRLKSLTSFINNIEPTPKTEVTPDQFSKIKKKKTRLT